MRKKNYLAMMLFFIIAANVYSQIPSGWSIITDSETGIEFVAPANPLKIDTLLTTFYSSEIDETQAIQVHIFKEATFNSSEPVFNEALQQENGDTLRAIAKLILLATDAEITEIVEVFTNSVRGLEVGIFFNDPLQSNTPYHSFMRYYLIDGLFVSFTWTGEPTESNLRSGNTAKNTFFNSINIE